MPTYTLTTKYGKAPFEVRSLSSSRVYVVTRDRWIPAGHKTRSGRELKKPVCISEGAVLTPRRDPDDSGGRLWLIHRHGIFDALRGRAHTVQTEDADNQNVTISVAAARAIVGNLLAFSELTEAEQVELRREFNALCQRHVDARNGAKVDAFNLVFSASSVRDRTGRRNPNASAARVVAAERRFNVRLSEIQHITPRVSFVEAVLVEELLRIWRAFDGLEIERRRAECGALSEGQKGVHARAVAYRLHRGIQDLATLYAAPFHVFRDRVREEFATAADAIEEGRYRDAVAALAPSISALAYKFWQRKLERVLYKLSMLLRRGTLTESERRSFADALHCLQKEFLAIDDSALMAPKREKVTESLDRARLAIHANQMRKAKDYLKSASHRI